MKHHQTPGVYYERVDAGKGGITSVRMDVPGFVGIAERGPVDTPVPVQSWRQFEAQFGSFSPNAFLAYTVRGFFENGGHRCWVVRVASREPAGGVQSAALNLNGPAGVPIWQIQASSPGSWGNAIGCTLTGASRGEALSGSGEADAKGARIASVSGFERGSLVHITQSDFTAWRVLCKVDSVLGRIYWMSDAPEKSLPYEAPLEGFNPDEALLIQSVEYQLVVSYLGRPVAMYENLSLIPECDRYGPRQLPLPSYPKEISAGTTADLVPLIAIVEQREPFMSSLHPVYRHQLMQAEPLENWLPLMVPFRVNQTLAGGADGLATLRPEDFCGAQAMAHDGDTIRRNKLRGFRTLDAIAEVSSLAVPDIHVRPLPIPQRAVPELCLPNPCLEAVDPGHGFFPLAEWVDAPPLFNAEAVYSVQADLVNHCENREDRIALLDPPFEAAGRDEFGISAIRAWRQRFDSTYAALYYPWLRVMDPLRSKTALSRDIPPSGHVLGQYAAAERTVGVHKAPANSPLVWVQDLTHVLDNERHGLLNHMGLNVVRSFWGRGIRIMGARTLSADPDWRYINVRRLLLMIKKAIRISIQWAAFEPNNMETRNKLRLGIFSFLLTLWQEGALSGASADQALFVKCDEENNPPEERNTGRLWVHVGVAPVKPFEFIVLRVGRIDNAFEIAGRSRVTGGR